MGPWDNAPQFRIGTFWSNISPHRPNEDRMGNLEIKVDKMIMSTSFFPPKNRKTTTKTFILCSSINTIEGKLLKSWV